MIEACYGFACSGPLSHQQQQLWVRCRSRRQHSELDALLELAPVAPYLLPLEGISTPPCDTTSCRSFATFSTPFSLVTIYRRTSTTSSSDGYLALHQTLRKVNDITDCTLLWTASSENQDPEHTSRSLELEHEFDLKTVNVEGMPAVQQCDLYTMILERRKSAM